MTRLQRILVTFAGTLIGLILVFHLVPEGPDQLEEAVPAAPLFAHDPAVPQRSVNAKGHPELFVEVRHAIRASEDGKVHYPTGYRIHEYNKALANSKNVAVNALDWVERGPGNVGGRTRPLLIDPDDPDMHTWFVGTAGGGLWWTQNRGYAWGYLTDNLPNLSVTTIAMAESNHDILYIGTGEGFGNLDAVSGAGIFKSYDRGQSWEHLLSTARDSVFRYVNRLAVDPVDADVVVAATNAGIYRTTDGGITWAEVFPPPGRVQDLQAQPGNFNTMIAGVNPGGILHSADGGQTWDYGISSLDILGGSARIELAYAPSDPSIAYASVENSQGATLLRSEDGGASWANTIEVDFFFGPLNWLGGQGWYDNSIAVHPYSTDSIFVGGILLWRNVMEGGVSDFAAPTAFVYAEPGQQTVVAYIFGLGTHLGGNLLVGSSHNDFVQIAEEDNASVEIRWGQGTQMAHRFTSNDSTSSDVDCFFLPYDRNEYKDYVEVPFTVWDIDSGRQLAVSFRDSGRDSTYNLLPFTINGPCDEVSNEQLFIHKYDYDATAPHDSIAVDAGLLKGMMYMVLPFVPAGVWDPQNVPVQTSQIVYRRISGVLHRTVDGSLDPTVDTHVDHHAIVPVGIDEADNAFWVLNTNDGGVAISTDGGVSFVETDLTFAGFNTAQFYGADKRPGFSQYVGGTQDNGSWLSYGNPNNRRGWINTGAFGDGFSAIWHTKDQDRLIATTQFNILWFSTNRGASWDLFFSPDPGIFMTSIDISPLAPDTLYMLGQLGVWRSTNFDNNFTLAPIDSAWAPTNIGKVRASHAADSIVWAGYGLDDFPTRTLWYSTNAGQDFSPAALPDIPRAPATIISGLATHPFEDSTAYALFSRYKYPKILETKDLGQTWADISGYSESTDGVSTRGFPNVAVYDLLVMPHAPHVMWAGTDIGLFKTKSHGKEWNYAHNGLPAVSVYRLKYRDDEIVAATHGRGVWTVPWSQIDVSIDEDDPTELPTAFSLEPNYPNPFNPATTITFSVPEEVQVRLTVFDVIGRKVAVLTDQAYSAGVHELVWDASAYASGTYFYRMEAGGKLIQTQKMLLLK